MPLVLQIHLVMMSKYSKFDVDTITLNTFWVMGYNNNNDDNNDDLVITIARLFHRNKQAKNTENARTTVVSWVIMDSRVIKTQVNKVLLYMYFLNDLWALNPKTKCFQYILKSVTGKFIHSQMAWLKLAYTLSYIYSFYCKGSRVTWWNKWAITKYL